MKKRLCRYSSCCKELPVHLTSAHHCNIECYKRAKKIRQKKVDDLIKPFRKGIYSNYKLFEELLPNSGTFNIDVTVRVGPGIFTKVVVKVLIHPNEDHFWQK